MIGYDAYKKSKHRHITRIDLILTLYRKALDNLARARQALVAGQADAARPHLANTQIIVTALAADLPAYRDASAVNFLRLYEFVAHQMTLATLDSIDAAERVLRPLLQAFETVREQAVTLERQGEISPLTDSRLVSCTA